jgi:putative transposase
MTKSAYPTDLKDTEWQVLEPLIPPALSGSRPRTLDMRKVVNSILYVTRGGCQWRMTPHDLSAWQTAYYYFRRWQKEGVWERINATLRREVREQAGREVEPSSDVLDSQSVKTTEVCGPRGYDAGKRIKGRKRHILVDTMASC